MTILVIGMVIGGLIGMWIGTNKGRPGEGFIRGALLGVIGWIIIAYTNKTKKQIKIDLQNEIKKDRLKKKLAKEME